jgi:LPPG:FO 2-phospho-L-lactate transferase
LSPAVAPEIVVLGGGLGAARLGLGLQHLGMLERSLIVANVADDHEFYGLRVAPDFDTIVYTLAGLIDDERGWGVRGDTSSTMDALTAIGGSSWFHLGDRDLATHLLRTQWLEDGVPASAVARRLCEARGLPAVIVPVTEDRVRTRVRTADGQEVDFQTFHVRLRAQPRVVGVRYEGIDRARPVPGLVAAIEAAGLVVLAPSSPVASVIPILEVAGVRTAVASRSRPTIAITPLVVAAPPDPHAEARARTRARLLAGIGVAPTPHDVAALYSGLIDAFVVDELDAPAEVHQLPSGVDAIVASTISRNAREAAALLGTVLEWAGRDVA